MGATSHDLHIDQLQTAFAQGYRPEGFIADMVLPIVGVPKQTDLYPIFSRADRLRRQNTGRSPGAEARRVEESIGSGTYHCPNYALKRAITIEDRANADPVWVEGIINRRATFIMDHLLLDMEIRVAATVNSTSNVGSNATVSSAWTGAGADPLANINTGIDNVHLSNGVRPNRVVFGLQAWNSFRRHSTVRNLIFGTNNGGGYPNVAQVAQLLNVDQVLIGGAFQNTGEENLTESLSTIWTDNVLIYYANPTPDLERPSYGYMPRWTAPGIVNMTVERHPYNTRTKSEEIEIGYYQDELITGTSYAFLIRAVNSSQ